MYSLKSTIGNHNFKLKFQKNKNIVNDTNAVLDGSIAFKRRELCMY